MKIIETCPKCGHDLVDLLLTTYPPIPSKECYNCGWKWEGEPEEIIRLPFGGNTYASNTTNVFEEAYMPTQLGDAFCEKSPCVNCSNNPKNGGSGVCHCTLGQSTFW